MPSQGGSLRILARCHVLRPTGTPLKLFDILTALAPRHRVTILNLPNTADPDFIRAYRESGVQVSETAQVSQTDIAIVNSVMSADFVCALAGRVPVLWSLNEPMFGARLIDAGKADPTAFERADRVVMYSEWQAREVFAPWLRPGSWAVLPTAIPAVPKAARRRTRDGRFRLVQVGSVEKRKGVDLSVEALRRVADPTVELHILGDMGTSFARTLKAATESHPVLAKRVCWHGHVSRKAVQQAIADADAMVFPTRDDLFAQAIQQAMAQGVPVIASALPAITEAVTDGQSALLVPPGDPSGLAEAIARLKASTDLCQRLALAARSKVMAERPFTKLVKGVEAELHAARKAWQSTRASMPPPPRPLA